MRLLIRPTTTVLKKREPALLGTKIRRDPEGRMRSSADEIFSPIADVRTPVTLDNFCVIGVPLLQPS